MATIRFNYADVNPRQLRNKKALKSFIIRLFEMESKQLKEINYIFCSDEYLLNINKSFLSHDFFTDIITFDLSFTNETVGEVYISVERVKENSLAFSNSYTKELLRVMFHGALHLIGYKDKKKSEITVMRQKEDYYLQLFEQK